MDTAFLEQIVQLNDKDKTIAKYKDINLVYKYSEFEVETEGRVIIEWNTTFNNIFVNRKLLVYSSEERRKQDFDYLCKLLNVKRIP